MKDDTKNIWVAVLIAVVLLLGYLLIANSHRSNELESSLDSTQSQARDAESAAQDASDRADEAQRAADDAQSQADDLQSQLDEH